MKKFLVLVCMVALVSLAAAGAYASDSAWYIQVKATNATAAGSAGVTIGVGTTAETNQVYGNTSTGQSLTAESTDDYGDAVGTFHSKHDVLRDTEGTEEYAWDLKMGGRPDYSGGSTIRIQMWNNKTAQSGSGGELNSSLAYALYKGGDLLCWFSSAALKTQFLSYKTGMVDAAATTSTGQKWNDVTVLMRNASFWNPTSASQAFYVEDAVTKSVNGSYADLASYRFEAFGYAAPEITPEPGSLMALGSGLIGLAGFAIRRRK